VSRKKKLPEKLKTQSEKVVRVPAGEKQNVRLADPAKIMVAF
jgi:hypothetical protein